MTVSKLPADDPQFQSNLCTSVVIGRFLLAVREEMHILVQGEKLQYAENIRLHRKNFNRPGYQAPAICALLTYYILNS